MSIFKLSIVDRLNYWKKFRSKIGCLTFEKAAIETQRLWQPCPFSPYYLDVTSPQSWPDPWQLLEENHYCDLAKCLGIVYTLYLTVHGKDLPVEIRVYYDQSTKYTFHVAYFFDGKYVLNLAEDEIVNKEHISQRLKLTQRYTTADLKLEQY